MLKILNPSKFFLPQKILWIFVGLFSLGQLQRVEISPAVAFYFHDLFILGWLSFFFIFKKDFFQKIINDYFKKLKKNIWLKIFSTILLISLITTFWYCLNFQTLVPLLYLCRLIVYVIFATSIYYFLNNSRSENFYLKIQYLTASSIIAILGLIQLILLPDVRFLYLFGWDDHYYRLISTLFDPAFTGLILLMGLLFSLKLKSSGKIIYLPQLLLIVAILFTYSRATYLAGVGALIYYWLSQPNYKNQNFQIVKKVGTVFLIIVFSSVALQFFKGGEGTNLLRTSTIYARIENIKNYLQQLDAPTLLVGKGWFTFPVQKSGISNHSRVPDNSIILLINNLGVPGLILFSFSIFKLVWKKIKFHPELTSVIIAIIIHSQFNNAVFQPFVWLYFWWGAAVFLKNKSTILMSR